MWLYRVAGIAILVLGLAACGSASTPEVVSPSPGLATPTELPYMECGWQWATQPLPELSAQVGAAFSDAGLEGIEASAYAFGENCLDQNGEVNRFAAMQTDFDISVTVADLSNPDGLGDLAARILDILVEGFPTDNTPGPMPGRASLTFVAGDQRLPLVFSIQQAADALDQGLSGADLLAALGA